MLNEQSLRIIFEREYKRAEWYNVLRQNFGVEKLREPALDISARIKGNDYNAKAYELGDFETPVGQLVGLYEVQVQNTQLYRNRRALRDLLDKIYLSDVDAALVVFIQEAKWRFTYVSEITVRDASGKRERKGTDPKRYTYLFGKGEKALTAARQFSSIKPSEDLFAKGITLKALQEAFNVEKMSKAFFNEYRKHYGAFTAYLTGEDENSKEVGKASPLLTSTFGGTTDKDKKEARDFIKKMLGRIVFLYFLEKKGWLGVPVDASWGKGDENFLSKLFATSGADKDAFYSNVLAPLFFNALNTERRDDVFKLATGEKVKIPFLNGGLFEEDEWNTRLLTFPKALFANLFDFFDRYNFTVYEDSPDEHTVAVDPEMLGHIFENLLEDNKDKGAYYTPKEIVHYMCQESLIEYLYTKLNPVTSDSFQELGRSQTDMFGNNGKKGQLALVQRNDTSKEVLSREALKTFIKQGVTGPVLDYEQTILTALYTVKVCDPAIGSGAFPMGVLMEIFHAVETLFEASAAVTKKIWKLKSSDWVSNRAAVKAAIIQNSIYGVDIEQGAVDIARLRFWLSLVVDEEVPQPLPNLDYKIVVGNSLLSKFGDVEIDIDWNPKGVTDEKATKLITQQQVKLHLLQQKQHLFFVSQHGNKKKLKEEIINLKIEILANQLELTLNQYKKANPFVNTMYPTAKEQLRKLQIKEQTVVYTDALESLKVLRKKKTETLDFFDWKLDFPEVMNDKIAKEAGFDIVIGNPPYVKVQNIDKVSTSLFKRTYKSATGKYDLYVVFIEKSFDLVKSKGSVIFINPHRFLIAEYGEGLRSILYQQRALKKIVHFGVEQIFDAAITYTGIFSFKRNSEILYYAKPVTSDLNNLEFFEKKYDSSFDFNLSQTSSDNQILKKILSHKKVSEIFEGVYQGVIPMGDKIQVLEGEIKGNFFVGYSTALGSKIKIESDIVKPLLKGEHIQRYKKCHSSIYIFYPHYIDKKGKTKPYEEKVLKNQFPLSYEYISNFRKELKEKKVKYKTNPTYWFSLHRSREKKIFENAKLITPQLQNFPNFTIDENGFYPDAGGYILAKRHIDETPLKIYLGLFNSKLFYYFIKSTSTPFNNNYYYFKTNYIEPFGIPPISEKLSKIINSAVDKIIMLKAANHNKDAAKLESSIDLIIYKLYSLTYIEASIIEGNTEWMSEEEFNNFCLDIAIT